MSAEPNLTMSSHGQLSGRRVLVAAEYIQFGGTRTYFRDLLKFYHRNGAEVVAVTTFSEDDPDMVSFVQGLGFELIRYSELVTRTGSRSLPPQPTVWSRSAFSREADLFRKFSVEFDLNSVTVSVGTSGLFLSAAATARKPLIIAHGYPHGIRQKLLGKSLLARLVPPDATILTVSDYSANRFREAWNATRNGIDVRTVRSTCGDLRPLVPLEERERLVLTAALVEAYKQPFDWIDIAARTIASSPGSGAPEFTWLGDGPLRDSAVETASRTGHRQISFPGWAEETAGYYDRARVYLQTSSTESLGLSVVDALRSGLPAVVTDAGGLPEVVMNGVNGFVVPVGDVSAAVEAVRELLHDDALWRRQAKAARELYDERFSPAAWEAGLLEAHRD